MADQLTWTNLKPRFQMQFAVQLDKKLIIEGLSNRTMKLMETNWDLLNRVTDMVVIIKESYAAYLNKVQALLNNANCRYLTATAEKFKNDAVNNAMQFFKIQLFLAALPEELHNVVPQRDQTTITLDDMYCISTTTQRESNSKVPKAVTAVKVDEESENDDENIAAFQRKQAFQGTRPKNSNQSGQPKNTSRSGPGNNYCKYCYNCKIQNHQQEECRKMI
jgi:hypothetical protein